MKERTGSINRRGFLGRPDITTSTTGVPVATICWSWSSCRPGRSRVADEAVSPTWFCRCPTTTTATSQAAARATARPISASSSWASGVPRAAGSMPSNGDRKTRSGMPAPGACSTRTSAPSRARRPGQDRNGVLGAVVEDPRPESVALAVGKFADHRHGTHHAGIQRQGPVRIPQQYDRACRRPAGPVAARRGAEIDRGGGLVEERFLEQAEPERGCEDPPDGLVDGVFADQIVGDRIRKPVEGRVEEAHLHVWRSGRPGRAPCQGRRRRVGAPSRRTPEGPERWVGRY